MDRNLLERGQVLPLVAVCLAVLMGFGGMAMDVGYLEYQQRQQQNAADGAAVGAAQQLVYSGCPNQNAAQTAAENDSAYNDFAKGGSISVVADNPPKSGSFSGDNCAVMATVSNSRARTFFLRLFGWTNGMAETTSAVATVSNNGNGCVYLLDPAGNPTYHGAKISAPGCSLLMNGSPDFNGGTIDFAQIGYAGSLSDHGTKYVDASPAPMVPVEDPCPEITGCNSLAKNPPGATGCVPLVVSGPTINPGCYSSFSTNSSFTMNPGAYVLTGKNSLNGAFIQGSGVTIYVTDTGSGLDLHGVKVVNLSPCTTTCNFGAVANVLYYQGPNNHSAVNFAGPSGNYTGLLYAPGASVTYDGNAGSGYTVMVFGDWLLNGTGQSMTFASPPPNGSLIKKAVLVQ